MSAKRVILINKKEFLLQSIIQAYIENLEPIGSSQLKSMYDIAYSPATIRGYFKKLGEEGYLVQEHISSGRIPTYEALKEYWSKRLSFSIENIDFEMLKRVSKQMGVSIFIKQNSKNVLQNIFNIEYKYMILEFGDFSISIKYNSALHKFLNDMIGLELDHIINISKQVGAFELYKELSNKISNNSFEILNIKNYLKIAVEYNLSEDNINEFLKGNVLEHINQGIYYEELVPAGYIGICHDCKVNNEDIKMLVVGELSKDYEYFYERIAS